MIQDLSFQNLTWQQFEKLLASLLEAEGFVNVIAAGGSGGDMGLDISAEEIRRSISGRVSTFRWMIQAKHYAGQPEKFAKTSPRNVGHQEINDVITFLSEHKAQGFLLITDTDLTSSAVKKITTFHEDEHHPFEAHFWNKRILEDRLRKHPDLVDRYFSKPSSSQSDVLNTKNPFKFLESYKRIDRSLFFGRDKEILDLAGITFNSDVAVLFGESGTGKTSLLNAGLLPQLSDHHFLTVYTRCLDEPSTNMRREILRALNNIASSDELANLGATTSIAEFFKRLKMLLGQIQGRMVVVVDQFEELFTRAGDQEKITLAEVVRTLGESNNYLGSLTIWFSIREDYLGSLWDWSYQNHLTDTWSNSYRLARLSAESAEISIVKPIILCGKTISKKLVAEILSDLEKIGEGKIYPPYVQIVCGSLFDRTESEVVFSDYETMGRSEGIIGEYLDSRMFTGLSTKYTNLARNVLDSLTGGEGLRTLLTLDEIQASTGSEDVNEIEEIIEFLIKRRVVLAQMAHDNVIGYELVHDFLSRRFFEKLDSNQKRARAIQDVFRRSFRDWKLHRILISKAALDEFFEHRETLALGIDQVCMILESAFASGKYKLWRDFFYERESLLPAFRRLIESCSNASALRTALAQKDLLKALNLNSLIYPHLSNSDLEVREKAIKALVFLEDDEAVDLIVNSINLGVNFWSYYGFEEEILELGGNGVIDSFIEFLDHANDSVRVLAVRVLGKSNDARAVRPLFELLRRSSRGYIRDEVLSSLVKAQDRKSLKYFAKYINDPDQDIRALAAISLANMRNIVATPIILDLLGKRANAINDQWGNRKSDPLRSGLLHAIGELQDESVVPHFISLLKNKESDDTTRKEAIWVLARIKSREAFTFLITFIQNKDEEKELRDYVVECFVDTRDERGIPYLVEYLKGRDLNRIANYRVRGNLRNWESLWAALKQQ